MATKFTRFNTNDAIARAFFNDDSLERIFINDDQVFELDVFVPMDQFDIRVTSPKIPGFTGVVGGTIQVDDNGDGTWTCHTSDIITAVQFHTNKDVVTDITVVKAEDLTTLYNLFNQLPLLTSLDVSRMNTSKVTDMTMAFAELNSLLHLDLSGFDTSNVTTMAGLCWRNRALLSIDMTGFDTSKVTDMQSMFEFYQGTTIDMSMFDTSNVTTMIHMFENAINLTHLDFRNFNFGKVTAFVNMLKGCSSLICLTNLDTTAATVSTEEMFDGCTSLIAPNAVDQDKISGGASTGISHKFDWTNANACP